MKAWYAFRVEDTFCGLYMVGAETRTVLRASSTFVIMADANGKYGLPNALTICRRRHLAFTALSTFVNIRREYTRSIPPSM